MATSLRSTFSMQSMESLYSNNSSKFSALHRRKVAAARQPAIVVTANNDVRRRVMSARMLRFKQLQNQLEVAHHHIAELTKDNRLLKALQKRQDSALSKYENTNAELPKLLHSHAEEVRTWQTKFRNLQNQNREIMNKLKAKDAHILTITDQNKHLLQLNKDKHLEERERLAERVRDLESRLIDKENDAKLLARRLQLESKNFRAQLQQEGLKQREMVQKVERAHQEINRLSSVIEIYEKRTPSTLLKNNSFLLKPPKPTSGQLIRLTNGNGKSAYPNYAEPSPVTNLDLTPKPKVNNEGEGDVKSPLPSPKLLQPITPPDGTPPVPSNSSKLKKKQVLKKRSAMREEPSDGSIKSDEHNFDEGLCQEFNQYALQEEADFDKVIASEFSLLQKDAQGFGPSSTMLTKRVSKQQYSSTFEDDYGEDLSTDTNMSKLAEIFEHKNHIDDLEQRIRHLNSPASGNVNGYAAMERESVVSSTAHSGTSKKNQTASSTEPNETDIESIGSASRDSTREFEAMKREIRQSIIAKESLLDSFCDELNGKELTKPGLNRPKLEPPRQRGQIDPKKKKNLLAALKAIDGDSPEK